MKVIVCYRPYQLLKEGGIKEVYITLNDDISEGC